MQPGKASWKEGCTLQLLSLQQLAREDKEKWQTYQLHGILQGSHLEMIVIGIRGTDASGTCLKKHP